MLYSINQPPHQGTGMPLGICTMDSRESFPDSALDFTGTPTTGSGVKAATMPGRCAAPPAPAMMTLMPRSAAVVAYSYLGAPVQGAAGSVELGGKS